MHFIAVFPFKTKWCSKKLLNAKHDDYTEKSRLYWSPIYFIILSRKGTKHSRFLQYCTHSSLIVNKLLYTTNNG